MFTNDVAQKTEIERLVWKLASFESIGGGPCSEFSRPISRKLKNATAEDRVGVIMV